MNDKKQTFKIVTEAGDTEITFRFIEMECIGDSLVISAVYESEMRVGFTGSTKFYYCQSKWDHAVIEAYNSPEAKEQFIRIINAQLEYNKRLSVKDVDCCIVNVYFSKEEDNVRA